MLSINACVIHTYYKIQKYSPAIILYKAFDRRCYRKCVRYYQRTNRVLCWTTSVKSVRRGAGIGAWHGSRRPPSVRRHPMVWPACTGHCPNCPPRSRQLPVANVARQPIVCGLAPTPGAVWWPPWGRPGANNPCPPLWCTTLRFTTRPSPSSLSAPATRRDSRSYAWRQKMGSAYTRNSRMPLILQLNYRRRCQTKRQTHQCK